MKPVIRYCLSLLAVLMLTAASPLVIAASSAGKIENISSEEVKQALIDTIKATEEALAALKSGASEITVSDHINNARQLVKRVEINRLDVIRTRSADNLKKAKQALGKDDKAAAEQFISTALKGFQEMQAAF